jgi:hypothetical protein
MMILPRDVPRLLALYRKVLRWGLPSIKYLGVDT